MPRYAKGTVNNTWDKGESSSPVPDRVLGPPVPPTDEALIRVYVLAMDAYQLHRTADLKAHMQQAARALVMRGVASLTEQQVQEARQPKSRPSLAATTRLLERALEPRS